MLQVLGLLRVKIVIRGDVVYRLGSLSREQMPIMFSILQTRVLHCMGWATRRPGRKFSVKKWTKQLFATVSTFLPLDEAVASTAIFVIVSRSDGRAETLLKPAK